MTRYEWEQMCEELKLIPDTLCQVDRHGNIIGGPWRFLDSVQSHDALQRIVEYMTDDQRRPKEAGK